LQYSLRSYNFEAEKADEGTGTASDSALENTLVMLWCQAFIATLSISKN